MKNNGLPSLFVAYAYSRPHPDDFLRSICYLAGTPNGIGSITLQSVYGFSLDLARNTLAMAFKESGCDFMLMVDNDAKFKPEGVERLVRHNLPMVCGCMFTAEVPPKPTIGQYVGYNGKIHLYRFAEVSRAILRKAAEHGIDYKQATNDMVLPQTDTDLMEVDGCGMHFTLIRKDVIEALERPYFMFLGSSTAGEDFYFCKKVRDAGFPIYLDMSVFSGHIVGEKLDLGIKELLYITRGVDIETQLIEAGESWKVGV